MYKLDIVDAFAILLLVTGIGLMVWGIHVSEPQSLESLVLSHFGDWTPGFVIDGVLLLVINRVIHAQERRRVVTQVASLSNEFALDAVRRCREEGWLTTGSLVNGGFSKARLATADLSDASLAGADLSFADLSHADLTHADLRGANLTGANLTAADLRWSNLSGADLQWSDLRDAQLDGADLTATDVRNASINAGHESIPGLENAIVGGHLSPRQIELVSRSLKQLLAAKESAVDRFYRKLFEKAPEVQKLFPQDMKSQARKFEQSLRLIVASLSSMERAAQLLRRLGDRHEGYGVEPGHYDIVAGVLIETLDEILGGEFSGEAREAWTDAFGLIASLMRKRPVDPVPSSYDQLSHA